MRSILFLLGFICLFFVGCSSGEDKEMENKTFRIARDPSWGNLPLMGKNAHLRAFSDDLLRAIAKEENIVFKLSQASTEQLFYGLEKDSYDGVLSPRHPRASQKALYHFSEHYFSLGPVIIVHEDSDISSLDDLSGKKLGILNGSENIYLLKKHPEIFIESYENNIIALDKLVNNEVDAVIMGIVSGRSYCKNAYAKILKVASSPLTNDALRLVTPKDAEGKILSEHFNSGLETVIDDGTLDFLINKWGFQNS
ncbi:MAG: transporter substrate-binding domain-containing protein [Waddliaceae bacterium]|jgi:polar amino acid transport system substrate-binding protein|nr:transporter substrate-binding domain-containing protein [Waddliaceae bacterium]MBT3579141.1 transporter substrate-binding domain-containing protein [Waddliaceae bacterium]MBT4444297.1 transporter substrate-binding domain-containing protein [Waddliaceae bacterium]MBT6928512.1 transporter substrate-binding domain-containing protein [Waddliaceae bacterium]MBT7264850.1 transporter substrate-binding domain-containing protein [Waddliaceae bacterium]